MSRHAIALVIPCLNEAAAIGAVLEEIPSGLADQIIVVDNGSTDGSGQVAELAGATVVREERPGYGWACWSGFQAAVSMGAEIIVFFDGDRSDHPNELRRVLDPLLQGEADLVLGRRLLEPGALPPQAVWGNRFALMLLRLLYGLRLKDIPSFRAIRVKDLTRLDMKERTYGWPTEMLVRSARLNLRITEVPVIYRKRIGTSKVSGTLRGTLMAGYKMLSTIAVHAVRQ
jgi:glycosyltransferase involved in cell wall biosynthesis